MTDLKWTPVTIRLGQIEPWSDNPRMSTKAQAERLIQSERELGQVQTVAVGPVQDNGKHPLYDGHQRVSAWFTIKGADFELTALQSNRPLTEDERRKMAVLLHTATGGWNWDKLSGWRVGELKEWGLVNQENVKGWNTDAGNVWNILKSEEEAESVKTLDELAEEYGDSEHDDFYPVIRIKVTPEIKTRFDAVMVLMPGANEMEKLDALISRGELS